MNQQEMCIILKLNCEEVEKKLLSEQDRIGKPDLSAAGFSVFIVWVYTV